MAKMPSPVGTSDETSTAAAIDHVIEIVGRRPLRSGEPFDEPVPWKSPCLADHRARSGHSCRDAPRAADLQLSTDGLQSYEVSRLLSIVRSVTSNASTVSTQVPSPAHSDDGPTPADAHVETRPRTTDTTTRTCAVATTTSEPSWSGPPGLFGPRPDESYGGNSVLSTIASSLAQSTTRSPHATSHGGNGGSRSDSG
jgi:hypothetical protein